MTDEAIEAMRAALAAHDRAAVNLAMELDLATSLMPNFILPSVVLQKLDDWREAAALLFPYLTEEATQHVMAAALAGPTQDQQDYIQTFLDGFLTIDELAQLLEKSVQETRELVTAPVFRHALEQAEQATREAADNAAPKPLYGDERDTWPHDPPRVVAGPGPQMMFYCRPQDIQS